MIDFEAARLLVYGMGEVLRGQTARDLQQIASEGGEEWAMTGTADRGNWTIKVTLQKSEG